MGIQTIKECWNNIKKGTIKKLLTSMHKECQEVITKNVFSKFYEFSYQNQQFLKKFLYFCPIKFIKILIKIVGKVAWRFN